MSVVVGSLAALVFEIVYSNQDVENREGVVPVPGIEGGNLAMREAANEAAYRREVALAPRLRGELLWVLVFFAVCVKNFAKFAQESLRFAESRVTFWRRRSMLAACFSDVFSFFRFHLSGVNLTTTPHM